MRILADQHPDAVKRYAHLKPAGRSAKRCGVRCPDTHHRCTRAKDHRGPHVAHGAFRKVVAVWDTGVAVQPSGGDEATPPSRRRRTGKPIGLPKREIGLWAGLRERIARTLGSVEQIAFLVFFLAFLGFALHWFSLLLG